MRVDRFARAFYELAFEVRFLRSKGESYQDFFSTVMEKRYPGDFMRARPWGRIGDRKNDGYLRSRRTLFQLYAPNEISAVDAIAKIDDDFHGALPHWETYFGTWIFVHNSQLGLGPHIIERLLALRREYPHIDSLAWGYEELRQEAFGLSEADMASLLGLAPSLRDLADLGYDDLRVVLRSIEPLDPTDDLDLRAVSPRKLEHNALSRSAATLLTVGMSKADLVRRFLLKHYDTTLGDRIAASFHSKYIALRDSDLTADEIFTGLQEFAGGPIMGSPRHLSAVLAVLAYMFERCDIFERPPDEGEAVV